MISLCFATLRNVKSYGPTGPLLPELIPISTMSTSTPPGWDASPSQVIPLSISSGFPGGERHCES